MHIERPYTPRPARSNGGAAWAGFLVAAFCVVGLVGLFGTYAAPLEYQREIRREAVMDLVAGTPPAQREGLREALGDSADPILKGDGPIEPRIAAERAAMRARFDHDADATMQRLRVMIVVVTIMGGLFGAVLMHLQSRG